MPLYWQNIYRVRTMKCPDRLAAILLCFILLALSACTWQQSGQESQWQSVPLPDLGIQPLTLNVGHVINPRFKSLDPQQLQKILHRSREMVNEFFQLDVHFKLQDSMSVEQFFRYLDAGVVAKKKADIVDLSSVDGSEVRRAEVRERMVASIAKTLENYRTNEQQVIAYAKPYLVHDLNNNDFTALAEALADTLLKRLAYWRTATAPDGQIILDSSPYSEWVWWDNMGYGEMPYDVVITNQLVASAEQYGMDVHSSLRGGITAGTTTYSQHSQFSAYAYITVYPMLNDNDMLAKLRDDVHYTDAQIIDYAAALLTHEVGHLLLHLGHPFGHSACIMSPTPLLKYRSWYQSLDASVCKPGSNPEMTPGVAKLEYELGC